MLFFPGGYCPSATSRRWRRTRHGSCCRTRYTSCCSGRRHARSTGPRAWGGRPLPAGHAAPGPGSTGFSTTTDPSARRTALHERSPTQRYGGPTPRYEGDATRRPRPGTARHARTTPRHDEGRANGHETPAALNIAFTAHIIHRLRRTG